jgi:Protein of unknown function (DUF4240)
MPLAEKGVRGKGRQPLSPPQHTLTPERDERFGCSHIATLTRMSAPIIADEQFWSVIDQARAGSSASASPERLSEILNRLSDDEVLDFGHMFYEKVCDLNKWRLWAAGYVIAGGMSDDSFHYFRSWIVGKGKNAFEVAMKDPDELGPLVDNNEVDNELLEYVAVNILEQRGVGEDPRDRSDRRADEEPTGEPFEEATVAAGFPKLAALFG